MRRKLRTLSVVVVTAGGIVLAAPADATQELTTITVPGLARPVDLMVDSWGVPHMFAHNTDDLFLAQGFNIARDRLFQVDTWRRRGLGLLSEVLGPAYVDQDRAARLFLYRGDMDAEWASYGPEARAAATRFTEGINAYIDFLADNPDAMPTEFTTLGYRPAKWRPEDVVRIRTHAIGENLSWEVARAKLMCLAGAKGSRVLRSLHPEHTAEIPPGLDPCAVPDDVLSVYTLATKAVSFADATGGAEVASPTLSGRTGEIDRAIANATSGSNAWAVGPSRTATGRPILANDPHRGVDSVPSGRYIAQLSAPGLNLVGAGEPWNPGLAIGHNGSVAFGLTNQPIDQTDLYVYDLNPNDPTRYRYRDGWKKFTTVTESIPVKGGEPTKATLTFTKHGPVVRIDAANNRAFAVRTVWTEPGTSPYLASLNYQRTENYAEFDAAMQRWRTPGSNLVFADTRGEVARVSAGLAPRRTGTNYDGLLPVPGDGRYEWDGYYANSDLASEYNPPDGFVASANDFNIPPGGVITNYEWQLPYRKQRIDHLLGGDSSVTVAGSSTLQSDVTSLLAAELLPYVRDLTSDDPDTSAALALLRDWDRAADQDSAAAALYEQWIMLHLHPTWAFTLLPEDAANALVRNINPDFSLLTDSFAEPDTWFGDDGAAVRDNLIRSTLAAAYADVRDQLGADPSAWRWGDLLYQTFTHPLDDGTVGPYPAAGDYHTVNAAMFNPFTHQDVIGPTFKMNVDVGAWDNSVAINAPGQSGDKRSSHYRDLMPLYATNQIFPLLYTREAVAANTQQRLRLIPD